MNSIETLNNSKYGKRLTFKKLFNKTPKPELRVFQVRNPRNNYNLTEEEKELKLLNYAIENTVNQFDHLKVSKNKSIFLCFNIFRKRNRTKDQRIQTRSNGMVEGV
jgi:hypothetical protein